MTSTTVLLTVLALSATCLAYPSISHGLKDMDYVQQGFLSRAYRQADEEGNQDGFKKLLLAIKKVSAQTVKNYGCPINPNSQQYIRTFAKSVYDVRNGLLETNPDASDYDFAQAVAAKVVSEYGCAGKVSTTDPVFETKFKAAYARALLETGDGSANNRAIASIIASSEYDCKRDPNSKDFIETWLSVYVDAVDRAKDLKAAGTFDEEGTDITRWHIAQVIQMLGCGNPDYDSEEFKNAFLVAQITIYLS